MAARDRHTRIVGWLKIALPLMALAILATLFLFSGRIEPPDELPFAEVELEERARQEQLTRPSLSGATERGDLIEVRAAEVTPDPANPSNVTANDLTARLDLVGGTALNLRADSATFDRQSGVADLRGDVIVTASTGHEVRTDRIELVLETLDIRAPEKVRSTGPEGELTAGGMTVTHAGRGDDVHLVFTDGVKLVYDPQRSRD